MGSVLFGHTATDFRCNTAGTCFACCCVVCTVACVKNASLLQEERARRQDRRCMCDLAVVFRGVIKQLFQNNGECDVMCVQCTCVRACMCVCVCVCVEGAAWGRNISSQWKADCARCLLFVGSSSPSSPSSGGTCCCLCCCCSFSFQAAFLWHIRRPSSRRRRRRHRQCGGGEA